MSTTARRERLRERLVAIEREMRRVALWQAAPPSAEALASTEPFCVDTLSLGEWLQWLLIPRMHALLDGDHPLPTNACIHAIAEESFKELPQDCTALLASIQAFDDALNRPR